MKRILVVDDDSMVRELLGDVLRISEYEVEVAASGEEACKNIVEKIDKMEPIPDLIITDLEMPEMSGEELIERMRNLDIKVILMSANHDELNRIRRTMIRKNIDAFIPKPFSPNSLLTEVKNIL